MSFFHSAVIVPRNLLAANSPFVGCLELGAGDFEIL